MYLFMTIYRTDLTIKRNTGVEASNQSISRNALNYINELHPITLPV